MPEYLAPGVYVEEVSSGSKPIEGVSTSTVGFLGRTERGPDDRTYLITSFTEYQRKFGGFLEDPSDGSGPCFLPHAVKGFFDNAGRRAYVSRASSTQLGKATANYDGLMLEAVGSGGWGRNVYALFTTSKTQDSRYRFLIVYFQTPQLDWVNPLTDSGVLLKAGLSRPRPAVLEDFDDIKNLEELKSIVNDRSQLLKITEVPTIVPRPKPSQLLREDARLSWRQLSSDSSAPELTKESTSAKAYGTAALFSERAGAATDAAGRVAKYADVAAKKARNNPKPGTSVIIPDTDKWNLDQAIIGAKAAAQSVGREKLKAASTIAATADTQAADAVKEGADAKLLPEDTEKQWADKAAELARAADKAAGASVQSSQAAGDGAADVPAAWRAVLAPLQSAATQAGIVAAAAATKAKSCGTSPQALGEAIALVEAATAAAKAATESVLKTLTDEELVAKNVLVEQLIDAVEEVIAAGKATMEAPTVERAIDLAHGTEVGWKVAEGASKSLMDEALPLLIQLNDAKKEVANQDKTSLADYRQALERLEQIDDISIVVAPEHVNSDVADGLNGALISSCERLADRVVLLSSTRSERDNLEELQKHAGQDSTFAAFYYPWIEITDPLSGAVPKRKSVPPIGHIAGICARSDIARGVHKAPANEVVLGALDLSATVNKGVQDVLNPRGVNCIRDFRSDGRGIRLWGARTISSDPEWKYLNVRRLFLFLEESIDQGTQWVVFEPNSDPTWTAVRRNITNFLTSVWRSGALQGNKPEEAFYVKCDYPTTMTQDDIDNGRLICIIGVAPVKPAEFVIIRISQKMLEAVA